MLDDGIFSVLQATHVCEIVIKSIMAEKIYYRYSLDFYLLMNIKTLCEKR